MTSDKTLKLKSVCWSLLLHFSSEAADSWLHWSWRKPTKVQWSVTIAAGDAQWHTLLQYVLPWRASVNHGIWGLRLWHQIAGSGISGLSQIYPFGFVRPLAVRSVCLCFVRKRNNFLREWHLRWGGLSSDHKVSASRSPAPKTQEYHLASPKIKDTYIIIYHTIIHNFQKTTSTRMYKAVDNFPLLPMTLSMSSESSPAWTFTRHSD